MQKSFNRFARLGLGLLHMTEAQGLLLRQISWNLRPQSHHQQQRFRIYRRLLTIVHEEIDPRATIHAYGSIAQTVSTCSSDMDLCVLLDGGECGDGTGQVAAISAIRDAIHRRCGLRSGLFAVTRARVPIVTFRGDRFVPPFDMGLQFAGVRNSALIRAYVDAHRPLVLPLLRVINYWGRDVGIKNSVAGGFSSYSLALMLLHHLVASSMVTWIDPAGSGFDTNPPAAFEAWPLRDEPDPDTIPPEPLARALHGFWVYFSHWDATTGVVHLQRQSAVLTKAAKGWGAHAFAIEDPLEPTFNPAHRLTVDRWERARGEFRSAARLGQDGGLGLLSQLLLLSQKNRVDCCNPPVY